MLQDELHHRRRVIEAVGMVIPLRGLTMTLMVPPSFS